MSPADGPELEQVERPPVGDGQKRRQEAPRALHLVRLHVLLGRPPREERGVAVERAVDVVPRRLVAEHEVVQAREQPQRQIPREVGSDVADPRIFRESATQLRVQR